MVLLAAFVLDDVTATLGLVTSGLTTARAGSSVVGCNFDMFVIRLIKHNTRQHGSQQKAKL
jgi:hypothetical protein